MASVGRLERAHTPVDAIVAGIQAHTASAYVFYGLGETLAGRQSNVAHGRVDEQRQLATEFAHQSQVLGAHALGVHASAHIFGDKLL